MGTAGGQRAQSPASHWVCCRFDCGGWGRGPVLPLSVGGPPKLLAAPQCLSPEPPGLSLSTLKGPQSQVPTEHSRRGSRDRDTQARCVEALHLAFLLQSGRFSESLRAVPRATHGDTWGPLFTKRQSQAEGQQLRGPGWDRARGSLQLLCIFRCQISKCKAVGAVINPRNHGPHNSCISRHLWGWGEPLG